MDRVCDFKVEYRFFSESEGGRCSMPCQGYRSDWLFEGDDPQEDGIYMIWPFFLDQDGSLLDKSIHVPESGIAEMHIVSPAMREAVHRNKVKVGIKGYLVEGSRKVAEATVTEIVGLHENQT